MVVLAVTRSRSWALGILIGQWAHVLTDFADTAGDDALLPVLDRAGHDRACGSTPQPKGATAMPPPTTSSLGGVWDLFWLVITLVFAWRALTPDLLPHDDRRRRPEGLGLVAPQAPTARGRAADVLLGIMFYGLGRLATWFVFARVDAGADLDVNWGGPSWVVGNDLSDASWIEVLRRTLVGGVLFILFLVACWVLFVRRLWNRARRPTDRRRGPGLRAAFGE